MENTENLKEAMEYLVETGKAIKAAKLTPIVTSVDGRSYMLYDGRMTEIAPRDAAAYPSNLPIYTLSGLIDWIRADPDHLFADKANPYTVRVAGPENVQVLSPLTEVLRIRASVATCNYEAPNVRYGAYMDAEEFGIMLQTNFIEDENRDVVLKIARNLTEEQSAQTADDGVSQRVTLKSGVKEIDSTVFRNPAFLCPLRTFPEIAQPSSPFVIRFKEGHLAAIYESDGGAWQNEAVKRVGAWLKERLADTNVVVIA